MFGCKLEEKTKEGERKGRKGRRKRERRLPCLFSKEREGKERKFHFPSKSFLLWRVFDVNKIKRLNPSKSLPSNPSPPFFCYPNMEIFISPNPFPSFPSISFHPNKVLRNVLLLEPLLWTTICSSKSKFIISLLTPHHSVIFFIDSENLTLAIRIYKKHSTTRPT